VVKLSSGIAAASVMPQASFDGLLALQTGRHRYPAAISGQRSEFEVVAAIFDSFLEGSEACTSCGTR